MKKIVVLIAAAVLVFFGVLLFFRNSNQQNLGSVFPTPTITSNNSLVFCKPGYLSSTINTQGAAGNIFGTLSIKNTSGKTCQIIGNNYILPIFNAKNITIKTQGPKGTAILSLTPNQTVYSQIHYPNGPQCNGQTLQTNITFDYKISPNDSTSFKNQNGETKQNIGVCESTSELTNIDVWSLSKKPVNQ